VKIWLPTIRANSGSDVYVERLEVLLAANGHEPVISWFPSAYELAPWLLRSVRPPRGTDLIHANSWNAFAFAAHDIPLVTTVHHGVRGVGYPEWKSHAQMMYHEYLIAHFEQRSFDASAAVIAVSASTAADIERTFRVSDVQIVDNWIDSELFLPARKRGCGPPSVLFVGNLSRRKGGDLLAQLRAALDPDVELHIVSGRRGRGAGRLSFGPNTHIYTYLAQHQLIDIYQQCDVAVCLSRHEGFGYFAAEAMACARPVIAFDVAGIRDVVVDGETGMLLPCNDISGIAAACRLLIHDSSLAARMGLAGRQRVMDCFSGARAIGRLDDIYRNVVRSVNRIY
jgi:glycosyltransferase involved in cell wall biosynthesis